ncbi:hypothetical protein PHISCL_05773 [Aspergillus sclerotialis]|uniref:Uncharacterized protein n=1 Tax=Aspergillus sclerotialis TaxID=2070753 RepID=A0A3A2ZFC9_9EURO|nr:hypothetical protein PHISCL_05773 [Aspergillus sclerotialis]
MPKRDKYADNKRLADRIERTGRPVDAPCDYCRHRSKLCIMSTNARSKKCSTCARRGHKCGHQFTTDQEWDNLGRDEVKAACDLAEAQHSFIQYAQSIQEVIARIVRLQKHQQFLRERGGRMLEHDIAVLERLEEEDPLSTEDVRELERLADEHDAAQIAALPGNNPALIPMTMNSPSFWAGFDLNMGGAIDPSSGSLSTSSHSR